MAHGKVSALDAELLRCAREGDHRGRGGPARALVLTGTGSSFSAGVDLFQVLERRCGVPQSLPAGDGVVVPHATDFPKPAVAAVNGHAIAGGCIIAAACDHRMMASGTGRIGVPELTVGVPFPALPFEIVGARVPPTAFRQLVYSGRVVSRPKRSSSG